MKIFLASDHAGFELKEQIKKFLIDKKYEVEDCGALGFVSSDDYPDFMKAAALKVAQNFGSFGIIFGKSGAGETMVANKVIGIRAVAGFNNENVRLSREDNDANVLSLGSEFVASEKAKELVEVFLNTPFSMEERHIRRVARIGEIENKQ
jgi:ribose 5-phosphate isomerase B